jgi:hypothetical protein
MCGYPLMGELILPVERCHMSAIRLSRSGYKGDPEREDREVRLLSQRATIHTRGLDRPIHVVRLSR